MRQFIKTKNKSNSWLFSTALVAVGAMTMAAPAFAQDNAGSWTNNEVISGSADTTFGANDIGGFDTNIKQNSTIVRAQTNNGDIAINDRVNIENEGGTYALRVLNEDPTYIRGKLSADGNVVVIDDNGVFFGEKSSVDVGGIIATTGNISDEQLDNNKFGDYTVDNVKSGEIVLNGSVTVANAGLAAFVAPTVKNSGVINAKVGKVAFASGEKVTIDMYGDTLIEIEAQGDVADAIIENTGEINAAGGVVQMSASQAKGAVDNIINLDGVVDVSSATQNGGQVILGGGDSGKVTVAAKVKAPSGKVKVRGQNIKVAKAANVDVSAKDVKADTAGEIVMIADETIELAGKLTAQGANKSGFVETSGASIVFNDVIDVSAGEWLIDPTAFTVDAFAEGSFENALTTGDTSVIIVGGDIVFEETVDWATANTLSVTTTDSVLFNAGGGINATGLGNFVADAGADIILNAGNTGILTRGGNVTLTSGGDFVLNDGTINVGGGNLVIDNTGSFTALANSLRAGGSGTITLNQNPTGTIQNAIDAINNVGGGTNTINVGTGTFAENVVVDHDNVTLNGFFAGTDAKDTTRAGQGTSETIIAAGGGTGVSVVADNVDVDGFYITGSSIGVDVRSTDDSQIKNNIVIDPTNKGLRGVRANNSGFTANKVIGAGSSGIQVNFSDNVNVGENVVFDSAFNGIEVSSLTGNVDVHHNIVNKSAANGIFVANTADAQVYNNLVGTFSALGDGAQNAIFVTGSAGSDILNNVVGNTALDGISVNASNDAVIQNNTISNVGVDGISVASSSNVLVGGTGLISGTSSTQKNTITNSGQNGVDLSGTTGVVVAGNMINGTAVGVGNDAINITNATGVNTVNQNMITNAGFNGVSVTDSVGQVITNNVIANSERAGVTITRSGGSTITGNDIDGTNTDYGIGTHGSSNTTISNNEIDSTATDGIYTSSSQFMTVENNQIGQNGGIDNIGSDGIDMRGASNSTVTNNNITETVANGIQMVSAPDSVLKGNTINNAGNDGILILRGDNVVVGGLATGEANVITNSFDDGIEVNRTANALVQGNTIDTTSIGGDHNGIFISHATGVNTVDQNNVANAGWDAIKAFRSEGAVFTDNVGTNSNRSGMTFLESANSTATGNTIVGANTAFGFFNRDSANTVIDGNSFDDTFLDGVYAENSNGVQISNNTIGLNTGAGVIGRDGVTVNTTANATVLNNTIANTVDDGISTSDVTGAFVVDGNSVSNAGANGLFVNGTNNTGTVTLTNNTFTDNTVGATFESGAIDISDTGAPNTFTNTNTSATPSGMVFDETGVQGSLTLVGNTLGGTVFDGFTNAGSLYTSFTDGTFLDITTNAPIIIDAQNASFDGVTPGLNGALLSPAQLDFIEARLFDATDAVVDGRGQIFQVALPDLDVEDQFNQFDAFNAGPNNLNVTITGLPSVGTPTGGAAALNNLAPAAGGTPTAEQLAGLKPAAGGENTVNDVANIEPAAGGQDAACWGNAINAAGTGTPVSYTFGTTFEESIVDAIDCDTTGANSL